MTDIQLMVESLISDRDSVSKRCANVRDCNLIYTNQSKKVLVQAVSDAVAED